MGKETGISWTDHTFNPWWGCTRYSPGCDHCYAEELDKHWYPVTELVQIGGVDVEQKRAMHWGPDSPRREMSEKYWGDPVKWNAEAFKKFGRRARVFCGSMCDLMDKDAPAGRRERLWSLVNATPDLLWLFLTKRPENYDLYLPGIFTHFNAMLMFTAESQKYYDLRLPHAIKAAQKRGLKTGVSYEPALGALDLRGYSPSGLILSRDLYSYPNWVIVGGETGHGRRPFEQAWAETVREQARALDIPFFMKQFSAKTPKEAADLVPAHLRIQEWPA